MKNEAASHQKRIEKLLQRVSESEGLNQDSIRQHSEETSQKASQIMQTYPWRRSRYIICNRVPLSCRRREMTHYEVLSEVAKNKRSSQQKLRSILKEEKEHLKLCTQPATENSSGS
jgi:ferritin-like metal-binding protein YciE